LEAKARALAGLKGYVTNLAVRPNGTPVTAQFVIEAYHRLFHIEKPSECPNTTCKPGRPTTTNANRIDAHLTIVFAALAVRRWIENRTVTIRVEDPHPRRSRLPARRPTPRPQGDPRPLSCALT
jgi:hypothetical protein